MTVVLSDPWYVTFHHNQAVVLSVAMIPLSSTVCGTWSSPIDECCFSECTVRSRLFSVQFHLLMTIVVKTVARLFPLLHPVDIFKNVLRSKVENYEPKIESENELPRKKIYEVFEEYSTLVVSYIKCPCSLDCLLKQTINLKLRQV